MWGVYSFPETFWKYCHSLPASGRILGVDVYDHKTTIDYYWCPVCDFGRGIYLHFCYPSRADAGEPGICNTSNFSHECDVDARCDYDGYENGQGTQVCWHYPVIGKSNLCHHSVSL